MKEKHAIGHHHVKSLLLAGAGLALLAGIVLLFVVSDSRRSDYLTWRWMVTFKVPVTPVDDMRIVVAKSAHILEVYRGAERVAEYPVALSGRGPGPRRTWADGLTPEGTFLIASMQYESRFGPRQMLLETNAQARADYVAQYGDDGRARIAAWETGHGALDTVWETYDFNEAYPEAKLWNDILIHGGGTDRDWTLGCIALDDADLVELFELLQESARRGLGVAVEIRP